MDKKSTIITALLILAGCYITVGAFAFAEEPLPNHVKSTMEDIKVRVASIEAIDNKLKPVKEELAHLQSTRDLLDADLRDDVKSLERWGYDVDWDSLTVGPKE